MSPLPGPPPGITVPTLLVRGHMVPRTVMYPWGLRRQKPTIARCASLDIYTT